MTKYKSTKQKSTKIQRRKKCKKCKYAKKCKNVKKAIDFPKVIVDLADWVGPLFLDVLNCLLLSS